MKDKGRKREGGQIGREKELGILRKYIRGRNKYYKIVSRCSDYYFQGF